MSGQLVLLDQATISVPNLRILKNCETNESNPYLVKFQYHIRSRVSKEVLKRLDRSTAELTTANMNNLFLLYEKFAFAAPLLQVSEFQFQHAVIDDEFCKRISQIEEQILQQDREIGLLQREISDLRAVPSHLAAESASLEQTNKALEQLLSLLLMELMDLRGGCAQEIASLKAQLTQEVSGLREQFPEDIAKALQEQAKSGKRVAEVAQPNFLAPQPVPWTQFMFTWDPSKGGEIPAGGIIWQQMEKCGSNVHEEAPVRSMTSRQDVAVFFRSVAKDPDTTKQKSSGYLTGGESQSREVDFTHCSGIFRLRGGSSPSKDLLKTVVPGKFVITPDGAHRIAVDFAEDCQGSVETFLGIKRLIEVRYAGAAVGIRLNIGRSSVAIPTDSNRMLVLYSSAESLRIPDWIEVIRADDFRFCPHLREVIAGLQREIDGFRDCQNHERVELSQSIEVIRRGAFSADEVGGGRNTKAERVRRPLFLEAGKESWLRRRRRGCQIFIAGKGPGKEEKDQVALSGIISYLTTKCGGNVHDRGVVEITASSVSNRYYPQNAADLGNWNSFFCSKDKPRQWICLDFKTVRIESTHYTIRVSYLKSWAIKGSDDGALWTEIDRHENNNDLCSLMSVKTFMVSRSGSFGKIRLLQTGPNDEGNNQLIVRAFEVFGAAAGLQ
jgi:hypothetical protein